MSAAGQPLIRLVELKKTYSTEFIKGARVMP